MKKVKDEEKKDHKKLIKGIVILVVILILFLLYARYIGPYGIKVNEYPINTTSLSVDYDGLKIVQFSDVHYGRTVKSKELKSMVEKINKQNPDIIVFTGDLIDEDTTLTDDEINTIVDILDDLECKVEIIAIKGEDDYETSYFDTIVENLNWKVLTNTYEYIYYRSTFPIVIIGLDDLTNGNPDYENAFSYLNELDGDHYTIILAHEPDQIDEISTYDFNIMLSGHSHLGQIRIPLVGAIYTFKGSKKYYDEHYIVNNTDLYISSGVGTSDINLRTFNKPSINLYRFYTK